MKRGYETVADILKEMRKLAKKHMVGGEVDNALSEIPIDDFADRIASALRRAMDHHEYADPDEGYEWGKLGPEYEKTLQNAWRFREQIES